MGFVIRGKSIGWRAIKLTPRGHHGWERVLRLKPGFQDPRGVR